MDSLDAADAALNEALSRTLTFSEIQPGPFSHGTLSPHSADPAIDRPWRKPARASIHTLGECVIDGDMQAALLISEFVLEAVRRGLVVRGEPKNSAKMVSDIAQIDAAIARVTALLAQSTAAADLAQLQALVKTRLPAAETEREREVIRGCAEQLAGKLRDHVAMMRAAVDMRGVRFDARREFLDAHGARRGIDFRRAPETQLHKDNAEIDYMNREAIKIDEQLKTLMSVF